jgi:hypothetical protein
MFGDVWALGCFPRCLHSVHKRDENRIEQAGAIATGCGEKPLGDVCLALVKTQNRHQMIIYPF